MRRLVPLFMVLALPASAGELCLSAHVAPCPGNDIAWIASHVGYNSSVPPCEYEFPGTMFRVTLSTSPTDPNAHTGPLGEDLRLYLWNTPLRQSRAAASYGWGRLGVTLSGNLRIADYEPIASGDHTWTPESASLWFNHCEVAVPGVIGAFVIESASTADEAWMGAKSWGGVKSLYR